MHTCIKKDDKVIGTYRIDKKTFDDMAGNLEKYRSIL